MVSVLECMPTGCSGDPLIDTISYQNTYAAGNYQSCDSFT